MELNGKKVSFHRLKEDTSSLIDLENARNNQFTLHQGSFKKNEGIPSPREENPQENARDKLCSETVSYE
jgi:hypothetical protein